MNANTLTRRHFAVLGAAELAAASAARPQTTEITARQIVERIKKSINTPWRDETVDTFKAGDPDTPVRGIATTFMATFAVLQRGAKEGKNFVVTHEPTFYNHQDKTADFSDDTVYRRKLRFIEENRMVVWRFHDHWHAHKPDGMLVGLAKDLGWSDHQVGDNLRSYELPATTLGELAADIKKRMGIRTLRVVGEPETKVSKAALSPGFSSLRGAMQALRDADVLVVGEPREWEGVEYAQDAVAAGESKALIILGHAISEDPGMRECAAWLRTIISEAPVEFVPAGEPFWMPE